MERKIDWTKQIGHRLKLRDLHVFCAVVQNGSMAKAAVQLGVSHPTVSEVISDLERTFKVELFDRGPRGVELTAFGVALLNRCNAAFDELKQSVRDIEFLKNSTGGELYIGCAESLSASILPSILDRFSQRYPRVKFRVDAVVTGTPEIPRLRDRSLDLVLARMRPLAELQFADDLTIEVLFDEQLDIVAGARSPWARRRKIDLSDLVDEPWLLTGPDNWNYVMVADAFRARGLRMPNVILETLSVHLRTNLIASGRYITALPRSVLQLYANPLSLKTLPVKLEAAPWLVAMVTLKHRRLSPVAERFIECTREFATQALG
jgi:DNA-binding transcriptional LysR family regulator